MKSLLINDDLHLNVKVEAAKHKITIFEATELAFNLLLEKWQKEAEQEEA